MRNRRPRPFSGLSLSFVYGGLGGLLAFVGLSGCGSGLHTGGRGDPDSPAARKRHDLRTLRIAVPIEVTKWDPAGVQDAVSTDVMRQLVETLLENGLEGAVRPGLATSWTRSPDRLRYRFKLGTSTFSDGAPVEAEDVKASLERAMDPAITPSISEDKIGTIAAVAAVDPKTVEIRLKRPDGSFLARLTHPVTGVIPRRFRTRQVTKPEELVGSGPYSVAQLIPGSGLILAARRKETYLQRLELQVVEPKTALGLVRTGSVDFVETLSAQAEEVMTDDGYIALRAPSPRKAVLYLQLSSGAHPFLRDRRFRQALALAVNRKRIAEELSGGLNPIANSVIPEGFPGHGDHFPFTFDLEKARRLLREVTQGQSVPPLILAAHERNATHPALAAVATDWQEGLGIPVRIRSFSGGQFIEEVHAKRLPVAFTGWTMDTEDPEGLLEALFGAGSDQNPSGVKLPQFEDLLRQATQRDGAARLERIQRAERAALEEATLIPLVYPTRIMLRPMWVTRIPMSPFGLGRLDRVGPRRGR